MLSSTFDEAELELLFSTLAKSAPAILHLAMDEEQELAKLLVAVADEAGAACPSFRAVEELGGTAVLVGPLHAAKV